MHKTDIHIENPCHESWDGMASGGLYRHCERCATDVHDLSGMTEAEAHAFLERSRRQGVKHCVRYRHTKEGHVRFKGDLWWRLGQQRAGLRRLLAASALMWPLMGAVECNTPHEFVPEAQSFTPSLQEEALMERLSLQIDHTAKEIEERERLEMLEYVLMGLE